MKHATIAAIRFGCGLGPRSGPASAQAVIDALAGPDTVRAAYPILSLEQASEARRQFYETRRDERKGAQGAAEKHQAARQQISDIQRTTLRHVIARQLDTDAPFRERLNMFWLDHFSAGARNAADHANFGAYLDGAIRPAMTRHFADLLRAVVTHPQMILYLDQDASFGPNSRVGLRQGRGLNENLARELLELHTLGVNGSYGQQDVRELAELLTGLQYRNGMVFRAAVAEPGTETVLGKTYGGDGIARLDDILSALGDLSVHPDTARHMAWKLAVHFVADVPDPALVAHIETRWNQTGGDLMQVYAALLEHPAAWAPLGGKAKQPLDFLVSSLRALGLTGADFLAIKRQPMNEMISNALNVMGQPFLRAPGPDGWPEAAEAWITPVGLSTRIRWAMRAPERLVRPLPDPRRFVVQALEDAASPDLVWAAGAADTVAQGVGLVLASPEFNRR